MLRRLANNQTFLADYLAQQLEQFEHYDIKTDFTPPSFYLYQCPEFSVRAVLWLPCNNDNSDDAIAQGYGVAHNHHFNFLTCGYFGPGYQTIIYHYDPESVSGLPGEQVKLVFQENTWLPPGKLMFYNHSTDIHVQLPPKSLSLSINLIFPKHPAASIQSTFDLKQQTLSGHLDALPTTTALLKAALLLNNDKITERLERISIQHLCPRTRAMVFRTLLSLSPENRVKYNTRINKDPSRYVRESFIHR